jgi:carboxyl-terminal processing protease
VESLKSLIRDDKMSNMQTYKRDIVEAINADIILRYAYNSGVLQHAAANDEEVAQAVELLLDGDEYKRILSEQHLDKH